METQKLEPDLITGKSFTYCFQSSKSPEEIFSLLKEINHWWSGIFNETIIGSSREINDEFSFSAGDGVHYSRHKLVALVPERRIVWQVIESNLSFVDITNEWNNTKISFDIEQKEGHTFVTFTHDGLTPSLICYDNCSMAWKQYMENLEEKLR